MCFVCDVHALILYLCPCTHTPILYVCPCTHALVLDQYTTVTRFHIFLYPHKTVVGYMYVVLVQDCCQTGILSVRNPALLSGNFDLVHSYQTHPLRLSHHCDSPNQPPELAQHRVSLNHLFGSACPLGYMPNPVKSRGAPPQGGSRISC